jgi:multidrug efflux pump subunit AcrA (membrane-fusion protein)
MIAAAAIVAIGLLAWLFLSKAAEKTGPSRYVGAAVTVIKAKMACFSHAISVSGMLVPREEVSVRPEREGFQISQLLVDAGDTVTQGQALARLVLPDDPQNASSAIAAQAPVAGIILKADAVIGNIASARAAPMFLILARGELELLGELPAQQLSALSPGQAATINVAGVSEVTGRVRAIAATVNGATQLGQVRIFIGANARLRVGAFGRAQIAIARTCNVSIPVSAVLYGGDSAFAAVIRNDRVETRQIVVGQLAEGDAEIRGGLAEGDLVVARAGAFFREGDRVRPFLAGAPAKKNE